MATYTNNVPQANQQISATQPTILANFQYLPNMLNVDHNFSNTNTGTDGYHKNIHMIDQVSDPATIAGIYQLYSRTAGSDTQLFGISSLGQKSRFSGHLDAANGYQYIGGLLLQWGTFTKAQASSPIAFPNANFTNVYSLVVTPIKLGSAPNAPICISIFSYTIVAGKYTQFEIGSFGESSSGVTGYYYMAIGPT